MGHALSEDPQSSFHANGGGGVTRDEERPRWVGGLRRPWGPGGFVSCEAVSKASPGAAFAQRLKEVSCGSGGGGAWQRGPQMKSPKAVQSRVRVGWGVPVGHCGDPSIYSEQEGELWGVEQGSV